MSKKILGSKAGETKLSMTAPPINNSLEVVKKHKHSLNLLTKKKQFLQPKSYRLNQADIKRIKKIMTSINQYGPNKIITETDLIRGLLVIGERLKPEKIIALIKDSF